MLKIVYIFISIVVIDVQVTTLVIFLVILIKGSNHLVSCLFNSYEYDNMEITEVKQGSCHLYSSSGNI